MKFLPLESEKIKKEKIFKFNNELQTIIFKKRFNSNCKTKYKNYFRDNEEREKLKKICKNTNIEYVDTGALAEAFFIINKKFKLIKNKKNLRCSQNLA